MNAAGSANKKFKNEMMETIIYGTIIKKGETKYGLIGIKSDSFDSLKLKSRIDFYKIIGLHRRLKTKTIQAAVMRLLFLIQLLYDSKILSPKNHCYFNRWDFLRIFVEDALGKCRYLHKTSHNS